MIETQGLTKYYNKFCAVDHLDLQVEQGEIVGLLGPNGAGKTTTLRMLTGYFRPTSGRISLKGLDLEQDMCKGKEITGYLPESAPLYPGMLVFDYLQYLGGIRHMNKDELLPRIREITSLCGLKQIMHKPIGELSRGLKQRVGLAHALLHDPEILILDEPTAGLDPNQILEIRDLIRQIGKEKTIVLSTHILSEAEATCDRVVIINQGKVVLDNPTQSIMQKATREQVIELSFKNATQEEVQKKLGSIQGVSTIEPSGGDDPEQLELLLRCSSDSDLRETLYQTIKETDWILLKFYQEPQTLEKIFQELTLEN